MASTNTSNGSAPSAATDACLDIASCNIPSSSTSTSNNSTHVSASDACLNTTELLEHILSVDMTTVPLAQRVSRKFKAAIDGSLLLQRKLFFVPATFEQALAVADGEDEGVYNWAVPFRKLPGILVRDGESPLDYKRPLMFNPALSTFLDQKGIPKKVAWNTLCLPSKLPLDESQSLSRMYLAHPLPKSLVFKVPVLLKRNPAFDEFPIDGYPTVLFRVIKPCRFGLLTAQFKRTTEKGDEGRALIQEFSIYTNLRHFTLREAPVKLLNQASDTSSTSSG